jgi:hypothetical protein
MNDTVSYPADSLLRTAAMSFGVKEIFNYGVNLFSGQIGIGLYNANNEFVSLLTKYDISELKAGYGWNSLSFSFNGLAANVQAGDYKLHVIYKKTSDIQWQKVRSVVGKPSFVNVRISSTKVYFDTPTTEAPELSLESLTLTGNLYSTKTGRLTMKIKNNGKEYNSLIGVYLQSVENDTVYQFVRTENVNLINAETRELNFNGTIELEPGNYYLAAMYDPNNHPGKAESLKSFGAIQTVEIKAAPTGTPSLYLNSKISFPNNSKVNKNFDVLSARLKNTGAYFDNKMIAFIFPTSGGSSLTYIGYQDIIIDNNETLSAQFKGAINLTPGQYMLILYHWNTATENWSRVSPNENSQIIFTLVNDYTAVNKTESKSGISIFPVPVRDFLNIKSEQRITDAQIYNIAGQLLLNSNFDNIQETQINISNLKSGSYIIRIHTSNGVETLRFVKQ